MCCAALYLELLPSEEGRVLPTQHSIQDLRWRRARAQTIIVECRGASLTSDSRRSPAKDRALMVQADVTAHVLNAPSCIGTRMHVRTIYNCCDLHLPSRVGMRLANTPTSESSLTS